MSKINRRDFLKMAGVSIPAILLPEVFFRLGTNQSKEDSSKPNIIILVFDAMSARNLSVYGYQRQTTPNFERFAERATVYHAHAAAGNFTISGTASLLTGVYPWTHRAINESGMVKRDLIKNNVFRVIGNDFHRLAFPQNLWADFIISQFGSDVDTLLSSGAFGNLDYFLGNHFSKDRNMAIHALDDFVFKKGQYPVSLLLGSLMNLLFSRDVSRLKTDGYPKGTLGLPRSADYPLYFRLEEVMGELASFLPEQPSPYFAYLHLLPPHAPYCPNITFSHYYMNDGYTPSLKPVHRLSSQESSNVINAKRRQYDQYVAMVDDEFGKFLDVLEKSDVLENSYIFLTSDHGEMFERGERGHSTPLLYDPVIHVPLLIASPGQTSRRDVYAPTNAVDLLPTFQHLVGKPIPSWNEGVVLPGFGGEEDFERSTYCVEAKLNSAFQPLTKATFALRQGYRKLICYTGYEEEDSFELYDLETDVEEMNDLYPSRPSFAKKMKEELLDTVHTVNTPYMKKKKS